MSNLKLVAPIRGWVAPLEEVPDPVFAERILGDGLAIDPTDCTVHAPCDAVVASVAKHAVTLRAANGAEILIHVGLETVALAGQGFVTHVQEGRAVKTGEPLITFDLDFLASRAKSLISPVIVTNGDAFTVIRRNPDRETGVGEFLMELRPIAGEIANARDAALAEQTRDVVVRLAHGIHARPAAVLANAAKRFACDVSLVSGSRRVNAKSVIALMSLGVRKDERVTVVAGGADAHDAATTLAKLIESGLNERPETAATPSIAVRPATKAFDGKTLRGVCGAPGLALGKAMQFKVAEIAVVEAGRGIAHETGALTDAVATVRAKVERMAVSGDRQRREILGAHIALLDDPELSARARAVIQDGKSAAYAWRAAVNLYADTIAKIDDDRMRERVGDLRDLERQVLAALDGNTHPAVTRFPPDTVLFADELLPSELVGLGPISGFCTSGGGPTSHVAILAAGMNVPALVSVGPGALQVTDGMTVILDADADVVHVDPDTETLAKARDEIARRAVRIGTALARADEDCRTADGMRIEVFANLGAGAEEAAAAMKSGAEGCGLLRTEFLFLDRDTPPTEDEQAATYQAIAQALNGKPFIIRTFDIGGDKPVAYLPFPPEENPALGLRGIRAGLWRDDLLRAQLGAILRVEPAGQCRIMLPMIASLAELRAVRKMLDELARSRAVDARLPLGVMVETPASAVLASQLAGEADFFSIGTNDLTQYTLAMDRTNAQLAAQVDAFHPAVLALIAKAAEGGRARGKPVGVCGGLAADPLAAGLLIGLGVDELSMPASAIPIVKARIRALDTVDCSKAAAEALKQDSADAVRAVAARLLPEPR